MPRVASGSCTVKNARSFVAPSVRAASISVGSVCSSAARTLFTTSGSAPIVAATTAPVAVKTIEAAGQRLERVPEQAAPPEHDEHVVAEHRRRHHHRRGEHDVEEVAPREAIVREQRRHRDADDGREQRRDRRDFEREEEGAEIHAAISPGRELLRRRHGLAREEKAVLAHDCVARLGARRIRRRRAPRSACRRRPPPLQTTMRLVERRMQLGVDREVAAAGVHGQARARRSRPRRCRTARTSASAGRSRRRRRAASRRPTRPTSSSPAARRGRTARARGSRSRPWRTSDRGGPRGVAGSAPCPATTRRCGLARRAASSIAVACVRAARRRRRSDVLAAAKTSYGAPSAICLASRPVEPKLNSTFLPDDFSNAAPTSPKATREIGRGGDAQAARPCGAVPVPGASAVAARLPHARGADRDARAMQRQA